MGIRESLSAKRKPIEFDAGIDEPVYMRKMSGHDRAKYLDIVDSLKDEASGIASVKISAHILIISLVDKGGNPVYRLDDIDEVMSLDIDLIDLIVNQAAEINGLSDGAVDDAEKK